MANNINPMTDPANVEGSETFLYHLRSSFQETSTDATGSHASEVTTPDWRIIFAIHSILGVNMEEVVFEHKKEDLKRLFSLAPAIQQRREQKHAEYYRTTVSRKRKCFIGSSLEVFIRVQRNEKKVVIVAPFCKCSVCKEPWKVNTAIPGANDRTFEFDTQSLGSVDMEIRFKYKKEECAVKLKFHPGVVDQFDMDKEIWPNESNDNFLAGAFYSIAPWNTLPLTPFKDVEKKFQSDSDPCSSSAMRNKLLQKKYSIKVTQISSLLQIDDEGRQQIQQLSIAFNDLYKYEAHRDFVVYSIDKKAFHCNKAILCVRSPVFTRVLTNRNSKEGQDGTITLKEDALATETMIKFLYFQDIGIERLNFSVLVGTLKLGYKYDLMDLMGTCAKALLSKMNDLEWEDMEDLWKLYSVIRKVNWLQIIHRLKRSSIMALRRLILAKRNKRLRLDDKAVADSINQAYGTYANLAKDLTLDLLKLLDDTT